MELIDFPITLKSSSEPVWFHFFSDIHRSAPGCDASKLRSDISRIAKSLEKGERHLWLGGGDWCNAISPKDKRFDSSAVSDEFSEYVGDDLHGAETRKLVYEFEKIRDAGVGICHGNHEDSVARYSDFNPSVAIAKGLRLPYLGYSCIIRLRLIWKNHGETVTVHWHHGYGAARTSGSKLNMLESLDKIVEADIHACGHVHEGISKEDVRMYPSRRGKMALKVRPMLFINAGTYLKTYQARTPQKSGRFNDIHVSAEYGEKRGYKPTALGHRGFKCYVERGSKGKQEWNIKMEAFKW